MQNGLDKQFDLEIVRDRFSLLLSDGAAYLSASTAPPTLADTAIPDSVTCAGHGGLYALAPGATTAMPPHAFGATGDGINSTYSALNLLPDGRIRGAATQGGAGTSPGDGTIWSDQ